MERHTQKRRFVHAILHQKHLPYRELQKLFEKNYKIKFQDAVCSYVKCHFHFRSSQDGQVVNPKSRKYDVAYWRALICNKFLSVLSWMKVHRWVYNLLQETSPQVCLRFQK